MVLALVDVLPRNIRLARERLGVSIEQAAKLCGLAKSTYVEAERGTRMGKKRVPGIETLVHIARGLGVPLYVLTEEEPKIIKYEHPLKVCCERVCEAALAGGNGGRDNDEKKAWEIVERELSATPSKDLQRRRK